MSSPYSRKLICLAAIGGRANVRNVRNEFAPFARTVLPDLAENSR